MDISTKCFVKDSDLVTRCIAGETIIVPVRGNVGDLDSIYTLNEVATMIWQTIDGWSSVSQIIDAVCQEYDVERAEAEKDVMELIHSLEAAGLVRQRDENRVMSDEG